MDEKPKRELSKGVRNTPAPSEGIAKYLGNNLVVEFIGSIVLSGIVGALADRAFGTAPWIMLLAIVFGFAAGMSIAWRATQKTDSSDKKE